MPRLRDLTETRSSPRPIARPWRPPSKLAAETRELWTALREFCADRGGNITTMPYMFPARVECAPDNELPLMLELATVGIEGKWFAFTARKLSDTETAGPVLRMASDATSHTVAVYEITPRSSGR